LVRPVTPDSPKPPGLRSTSAERMSFSLAPACLVKLARELTDSAILARRIFSMGFDESRTENDDWIELNILVP
jgi:hypothetical protein